MTRPLAWCSALILGGVLSYGVGIVAERSPEGMVEKAEAQEMRPIRNPHGNWIFQATGTRACAGCHDMGAAKRGTVPVLENAAVRNLIALGKGEHRGRFANCFRCHPGGKI